MKIATVIGARPQFIKAAVVSKALTQMNVKEVIIHTGQHYDQNMSDIFFDELDIPRPAYHLRIGGGTHGENTGRMIEAIEKVLMAEKPDWLLVYGDTDSTLAGALAAAKLGTPIAHVEAGLRSFNRRMPEELNRILTDHASTLLFTPTDNATSQLLREGIDHEKIHNVGDVMFDATLYYTQKALNKSQILLQNELKPKSYALATLHRAENTDDKRRLESILNGLRESGVPFIMPLHPRTKKRISDFNLILGENVKLIDPVGYLDMLILEKNAFLIATDSGGVQKEAYFHRVPCVTLRNETEWTELVSCGVNTLTGTDSARIKSAIEKSNNLVFESARHDLYGNGMSAIKVSELLTGKRR